MANGSQCCALEICCNNAAQKKKMFTEKLVQKTGESVEECAKYADAFLEIMEEEDLGFAPLSFQVVIDDVARIARRHPA